jgi:hypothetical protein
VVFTYFLESASQDSCSSLCKPYLEDRPLRHLVWNASGMHKDLLHHRICSYHYPMDRYANDDTLTDGLILQSWPRR